MFGHGEYQSKVYDELSVCRAEATANTYLRLHTSISFWKLCAASSHTVIVEIEGDALVPFGSKIAGPELELDEEEEVLVDGEEATPFALELETDPIVFELPIGWLV